MEEGKLNLVLVVCPLKSLMDDQVNRWRDRGFKSACTNEDLDTIIEGDFYTLYNL